MNVRLFKWIGTIILVFLLAGCASERNYAITVRSWNTGQAYAMLNRWGYPDKIKNLSNGDRRFIYFAKTRVNYKTSCTTWFEVNSAGKIVSGGYSGRFCRATPKFLRNMGNRARIPFMLNGM